MTQLEQLHGLLDERWHRLGAWRQRQQARRQELRQRQRELNRRLWGGPVEADRVLAFSDAIFAIAITLLTLNLQVPAGLHGAELTGHSTRPCRRWAPMC
jgi:Endosomal/lysosomal potassium channel TMEM175